MRRSRNATIETHQSPRGKYLDTNVDATSSAHRSARRRIMRQARFTLIHYIKEFTVYRESALFLVTRLCLMRRSPIRETATPFARSLARTRLTRAIKLRLRNRVSQPSPSPSCTASRRTCPGASRSRPTRMVRSSDNESREIVV